MVRNIITISNVNKDMFFLIYLEYEFYCLKKISNQF